MKLMDILTQAEIVEILNDAWEIDNRLLAAQRREEVIGHPVPLRTTLGHWEEMRLDQRGTIIKELRNL